MTDTPEALPPLPERDTSKPAEQQGLFRKFIVTRTDGSSEPGGKHEHCEHFVLDVNHDPHAAAALAAYADAVERTHPDLAADMRQRYALAQRQQVPEARLKAAFREGYFSRETYNDKDVTDVDEQWEKARAALTAAPSAQAEPQVPLPFTFGQRRRLWDNSPEIHADAKSFAAFERIVQLVEAARGIGKQEGKL